jgi:hypothetical protein
MTRLRSRLIAVDGVHGAAVKAAAGRMVSPAARRLGGGVSDWDASGLFEQLVVAEDHAGQISARTLLLLYASDLAFRLRWEIEPALAEGHTVVAAPYLDTAIAFGRAAGLPGGWLMNLLQFAPRPGERHYVDRSVPRAPHSPQGFVEFGCARLTGHPLVRHQELARRTRAFLVAAAKRAHATRAAR